MERLSVVLVHGFSGAPADLEPLGQRLGKLLGEDAVWRLTLPGHPAQGGSLRFEQEALVGEVSAALERLRNERRRTVVVGHSTGGNIALAAIEETGCEPDLLVLAATPFAVDLSYLERWQRHREGKDELSFSAVSGMVRLINSTGARGETRNFPILILQGEEDSLVPPEEGGRWLAKNSAMATRVRVPEGDHQLFTGAKGALAVETVAGAVAGLQETSFGRRLTEVEPEAQGFLERSAGAISHLLRCPSGRRLMEEAPETPEFVEWEPVFANIEISTRCNLGCRYCARSFSDRSEKEMSAELFARVLERLPCAYRLTLVGLGEPLLHPRVVEFVSHAAARGRRVALVTNAMLLTPELSARLLEAGLDSIAFSLDAAEPALAEELRQGTDLGRVVGNIRAFTALAREAGRPVSTAVFSAVSKGSVASLPGLIDLVGTLGVHVLMLSDLNFQANRSESLGENVDSEVASLVRKAVAKAFSGNLPVLTVRGLEEFGLARRYQESLLLPVNQLYTRPRDHGFCYSPWQTLPVDVEGNVGLCDCQPDRRIGNLLETPLQEIWNGAAMREHRSRMLGNDPPVVCRGCPRF